MCHRYRNAMKRVIVDLLLFRNCSVPGTQEERAFNLFSKLRCAPAAKNVVFADGTKREPVFSKPQGSDKGAEHLELLQHAREERERREKDNKQCLASKDGLRAGALVVERDNPVRWAMGPARHSGVRAWGIAGNITVALASSTYAYIHLESTKNESVIKRQRRTY
ncbi:hypothetical protein EDD22DRAFT_849257 [Suillus occidentalis]|nr:hypothetical protein EDD22DRAFT_849257 [Suillus occidentalis]